MRGWLVLSLLSAAACSQANPVAPVAIPDAELPALTGRIVDEADLLDAAKERSITKRLADLETRTGHQLVVVTVRSLNGRSIEDFSLDLGRTWGVGQKGVNDGLILLVAPQEHRVRIEVGYGLEAQLRDDEAAHILDEEVLPAFRTGDFASGIERGVERMIHEVVPPGTSLS